MSLFTYPRPFHSISKEFFRFHWRLLHPFDEWEVHILYRKKFSSQQHAWLSKSDSVSGKTLGLVAVWHLQRHFILAEDYIRTVGSAPSSAIFHRRTCRPTAITLERTLSKLLCNGAGGLLKIWRWFRTRLLLHIRIIQPTRGHLTTCCRAWRPVVTV